VTKPVSEHSIVIATARLILRRFTIEDMGAIVDICCAPEIVAFHPAAGQIENMQRIFKLWLNGYEKNPLGIGYWATVLKENGLMLGPCGMSVLPGEPIRYNLSYTIRHDYWGQGLATEAALGIRDYAIGVVLLFTQVYAFGFVVDDRSMEFGFGKFTIALQKGGFFCFVCFFNSPVGKYSK